MRAGRARWGLRRNLCGDAFRGPPMKNHGPQRPGSQNFRKLSQVVALGLFTIATCCHLSHTCSAQEQQPAAAAATTSASALINTDSSVNLGQILEHQQALVAECRKLEAQKLAELRALLEFDRDNDQVHLGNPVALKLPAVCLLLNGPPSLSSTSSAATGNNDQQQPMRLDLVNWLYDAEELSAAASGGNKTKRQAAAATATPYSNELLAEQWFDLNQANAGPPTASDTNELDTTSSGEQEQQFRAQLGQMLDNANFQAALSVERARIQPYLPPVVLIPGLAGSRLQARVSKPTRVNIICKREHDWQEMWLTLRSFLPLAIDCWLDNVRLEFAETAGGFTREPPGVESRVPQFGSVESVRHLDLKSPQLTKYFDHIIERYTALGYTPDVNLLAAPYDFRLAPQQIQTTFFAPLRKLIEHATSGLVGGAATSGKKRQRATLVCHSMGCTHLLIFLRAQSAAWRQARVRKVIALSAPWGGSIKALKALLVGEQFNIPLVSEIKMRDLARSFPGVAYMLPQAAVFGAPTGNQLEPNGQLLAQTPERNFRVDELEALLRAAGLERHWQWFEQTAESLIRPLEPLPDVTVDCIHSLNVPTTQTIIFRNSTSSLNGGGQASDYELVEGDGDGTVNHQSLLVCAQWAAAHPHRIRHKVIMNTSHSGILSHKSTLEHLTEDVATIAAATH